MPKTFWSTSPNSILENFFLFGEANFMQFLLDWGLIASDFWHRLNKAIKIGISGVTRNTSTVQPVLRGLWNKENVAL